MGNLEKPEFDALEVLRAKARAANAVENETPLQFLERQVGIRGMERLSPSVATTVAQAYLNGWFGASINFERANELLLASCHEGNAEACFLLAQLKNPETGEFALHDSERQKFIDYAVEQNYWEAVEQRAWEAERQYSDNDWRLETFQSELNELDLKITHLLTGAQNGDVVAQRKLGLAHYDRFFALLNIGKLEDRSDLDEAKNWLGKATHGDVKACYELASIPLFNLELSRKVALLIAAAYPAEPATPVTAALIELGQIYADQISTEFSPKQAEKCFRDALALDLDGKAKSAEILASLLWKLSPSERLAHLDEIISLFKQSWDSIKSGYAALCLGLIYLRGDAVTPDSELARDWFNKATKSKSQESNLWSSLAINLGWGKHPPSKMAWKLLQNLDLNKFKVNDSVTFTLDDVDGLIAGNSELKKYKAAIERMGTLSDSIAAMEPLGKIRRLVYSTFTPGVLDINMLNGASFEDHYVIGRLYYGERLGDADIEKSLSHLQKAKAMLKQHDGRYKGPFGYEKDIHWLKGRVDEWCDRVQSELSSQREEEFQRKLAQAEQEKQEAMENMMAMFAHKFRGPVDSILFNTSHQHDERVYVDAARTMNGLLDIFSVVSTSPEKLVDSLKDDVSGTGSPAEVLLHSIKLALVQLLSLRNRRRMSPYYLAFAKKQGDAPEELRLSEWTREKPWQALEKSFQTRWEQEVGGMIVMASLDVVNDWMAIHLLPILIEGFAESQTRFAQYGPKASLLTVILTEVLVNAIKHSTPAAVDPIQLFWSEGEEETIFSCINPSTKESRTREASKGSGRGHKFLVLIAAHLHGRFIADVFSDTSRVSMSLPSSAMKGKEK